MTDLLGIERLTVRYRGAAGAALSDVSLRLGVGERVGIVGASGSGKSTLAMCVAGLLPASTDVRGSIRVSGSEVVGASREELQRIRRDLLGVVFQNPHGALNPVLRVRAHFDEVLRVHGTARARRGERMSELLREVDLDPTIVAAAHPHELSGGMAQRVSIALALAGDPELLIADEPTTALDTRTQRSVLDVVLRISEERGLALLFVSHDLPVVAEVCTRVAVAAGGVLHEEQATADFLASPSTNEGRALVEAADRFRLPGGSR